MEYTDYLIFSNEARDTLSRKAVRTSIIDVNDINTLKDGNNGGSGLLVASRKKYYVLTAYHCIKDEGKENILVQWKDEKEKFHRLEVKKIIPGDEKKDWIILEVESPRNGIRYDNVQLAGTDIIYKNPQFVFIGYPNKNRDGRSFNVEYRSEGQWTVSDHMDFNYSSFADQVEGCSGAGVMSEENKKLFCVGIIIEVKGKAGLYQDVFTVPMQPYIDALAANGEDFFIQHNIITPQHIIPDDVDKYIERFCGLDKPISCFGEIQVADDTKYQLVDFVKGCVPKCNSYHYLLCGSPHSGKSYEMMHLRHQLASEGYEVKFLRTKENMSLSVDNLPKEDEENGRRIAIIIDALDETANGKYEQLAYGIDNYAANHKDTVIVVSTRDGYIGEEQMKGFTRIYLQGLNDNQINNTINEEAKKPFLLFEQIRENHLIDEVRFPFFLRFVIDRYNSGNCLPSNNAMLYKDWISLSYRQQKEKYPDDIFDESELMDSLSRMAIILQLTGKAQLSKEELSKSIGFENATRIMKNDLISVGDEISFKHNSIKEYLVARHFRPKGLTYVKNFVCFRDQDEINPNWRNVLILWLQLICGEEGKLPDDIKDWIIKKDKTILIACDPKSIAEDVKHNIFQTIMEDMSAKNQFVSFFNNSFFSRLYHFAECNQTETYIIEQIKNEQSPNVNLYNMMTMTVYVNFDRMKANSPALYEQYCSELFNKLTLYGCEENDCGCSFFLLNEHFYKNQEYVRQAFTILNESKRPSTIGVLLSLISRSGSTDEFIDYVVNLEIKSNNDNTDNYLNQSTLYKVLSEATDIKVIIKALKYLSKQDTTTIIHKYEDYQESVKMLLDRASKVDDADIKNSVYKNLVECFEARFSKHTFYVDSRIRKELAAYKNTIETLGSWSDELDDMYLTQYNQGLITPDEELRRRQSRQQDFDDFCSYETFRTLAHNLITSYEQGQGDDWANYGFTNNGHYNIHLNRYFAEKCGWRKMDVKYARKVIEDKEDFNCYLLFICAEMLYGHSEKLTITPGLEKSLCTTALNVLSKIIKGERITDDRVRKSAIQFLIGGKIVLKDEELIKLINYSHESIPDDDNQTSNYSDNRSLLTLMNEQMGCEKLCQQLRTEVGRYDGPATLQVLQWMRFLIANDKNESKAVLLERFANAKNPLLRESILDMLLEYDVAIEELSNKLRRMKDRDLLTCCEHICQIDGYKDEVIKILEAKLSEMTGINQLRCNKILLKLGSIIALKYSVLNGEEVLKNNDFIQFVYDEPKALPYLSALYPIARQLSNFPPVEMSILNSMGCIAASSENNYKKVCKELDDIAANYEQFADVVNYKQNFRYRLLQRMEKEMTIDEAIAVIS